MRHIGRLLSLIVLVVTIFALCDFADEHRPESLIDLRQFGYEVPPARGQFIFSAGPHNTLTFLNDDTLAISMFVRNPHPGLSVRNKIFGSEFLFQTVFLNAKTGTVIHTEQWSNASNECGLFFAPGSGFVVWQGLDLTLYASDGRMLKTITLEPTRFPRGVSLSQSTSGNMLFAENADLLGNHVLQIRVEGLEQIGWLNFEGYSDAAESDSHFAFLRSRRAISAPTDLFITNINNQDLDPPTPKLIFTSSGCLSVSFLDQRTLSVSGGCHELTIVNTSGDVLYQKRFDRTLIGGITPCRSCDILIAGTYVMGGGSNLLDIPQQVKPRSLILLNWTTGIFLEIPSQGTAKHLGAIALSPNGYLWAMQTDSLLRIYRTSDSLLPAKVAAGSVRH